MAHMGRVRTMACVLAAVTLLVNLLGGSAFAASADSRRKIVILTTPKTLEEVFKLLEAAKIDVLYNLSKINALAVKLPPLLLPSLPDTALALLKTLGEVYDDLLTLVDPVCPTIRPQSSPEDYPWGLDAIYVPDVHEEEPGLKGNGVMVAILDTGIMSHLEFGGRIATGYNAIDGGNTLDDHGHGTHMAGIIAADLGNGWIKGAAPQATLVPVKVLDGTGAGYLSAVIKGLEWVSDNGIRLVNMSFGFSFSNQGDKPLEEAVKAAWKAGIIMIASAGNCAGAQDDGGGDDCKAAPTCNVFSNDPTAPARYQEVIAVGATDIYGNITSYSQSRPKRDVLAPGGTLDDQILSTNNGIAPLLYGLGHGTSQAAAHVTGTIALALQVNPGLTPQVVRDLLPAGKLIDVPNLLCELIGGITALCP